VNCIIAPSINELCWTFPISFTHPMLVTPLVYSSAADAFHKEWKAWCSGIWFVARRGF